MGFNYNKCRNSPGTLQEGLPHTISYVGYVGTNTVGSIETSIARWDYK
jgi:hypothetical protein